jgi:hypothetical protein
MKDIEQTTLTKIDTYSYTAILGEPETNEIQAKAFINIREPINLLQQNYFNLCGPQESLDKQRQNGMCHH